MAKIWNCRKYFGKCAAVAGAAGIAVAVGAGNALATAPASLSEALTVEIDQTVVWAAMAAMMLIVGGIAAYRFVKGMINR